MYIIGFFFIVLLIIYIYYMYMNIIKPKKAVVFDMDETLGCYLQFGLFIDILETQLQRDITTEEFNILMDLYPLYQRPNILSILNYLKKKKQDGSCDYIYIYTNNQGPKSWAIFIKKYFEYKINYPLFDKIIHAYKINGQLIEKNRTSHDKSVKDFFNCTKISKKTKLCFLDDQYHPRMLNSNVYYLHLKPYHYLYTPSQLFENFKNYFKLSDEYVLQMQEYGKSIYINYNYFRNEFPPMILENEKVITKKMLIEIQYFINNFNTIYTRKQNNKKQLSRKNFTSKKNYPFKYIH